jgi:hypothetical protein
MLAVVVGLTVGVAIGEEVGLAVDDNFLPSLVASSSVIPLEYVR